MSNNTLSQIKNKLQNFKSFIKKHRSYVKDKKIANSNNSKRIYYTGFGAPADANWLKDFQLASFLPQSFSTKYISTYKPDVEFFSVFDSRDSIKKSKAKVKIFWTGEDVVNNYTNFSDECLTDANLSIGFDPYNKSKNYLRYPYWALIYLKSKNSKDDIAKFVKEINENNYIKTEFCSLIANHTVVDNTSRTNNIRSELYNLVSSYKEVKCAGKLFHNDDTLVTNFNDSKVDYLKQFMFNICPENTNVDGYVTEKLFDAFTAGCIPIYNGGGFFLENGIINQKAILYYNENNKLEILEKIKELWENKNAYKDFVKQPRLLDSAVDCIYKINSEAKEKIQSLFS